jgi:hypothetical protein
MGVGADAAVQQRRRGPALHSGLLEERGARVPAGNMQAGGGRLDQVNSHQ